jgi:hypothetical protein
VHKLQALYGGLHIFLRPPVSTLPLGHWRHTCLVSTECWFNVKLTCHTNGTTWHVRHRRALHVRGLHGMRGCSVGRGSCCERNQVTDVNCEPNALAAPISCQEVISDLGHLAPGCACEAVCVQASAVTCNMLLRTNQCMPNYKYNFFLSS